MKTGIIGLPQVGKSSLFRILTKAQLSEHAFANPSNPHYDEPSAGNAWNHVLAFLEDLKK